MDLLKIITHDLKIESNVKLISTIDEIKYIKQWDKYIKLLEKYKPINDIEKYLVEFTLKPETTIQTELGIIIIIIHLVQYILCYQILLL
jgi:hypothetical protein